MVQHHISAHSYNKSPESDSIIRSIKTQTFYFTVNISTVAGFQQVEKFGKITQVRQSTQVQITQYNKDVISELS